jgi:cytochrome c-type biogenesis protein CcmH
VTIGLAAALCGMTALALAMLLAPLFFRRHGPTSRDAYSLAVYRDQLSEVERDLARDVLGAADAEAARAEIARRILVLKPSHTETGTGTMPRVAATVAILLLPVAAWGLYWQLGSPSLPDQPFAERTAPIDLKEALAQLATHLKEHPQDLTGWLLLARAEMGRGHYGEAVEAYRHAADLSGQRADIVGDWGEAQVRAAGGTVTPAARAAFAAGLGDPETAPRSRYYLALAQMQQGEVRGALEAWVDLAAEAPADAGWLPLVRQRIAEAANILGVDPATLKGAAGQPPNAPADAAVAAAAKATQNASPAERQAMILAMVDKLASRLQSQPDDVEGWARLGRSYMVLNQPEKAKEAYARAVNLKPDDAALKQALAEASTAAATQPSR